MDKNKKIYRRSGISVACYVFAVILLIYTCYTAGNTVSQINNYYAQYGMGAQPTEYIVYIAQSILPYLFYAIATFMLGFILDAVRKTDPKNYMTEEEFEEAKIAKKEAREAKKFAKGEKKVAAKNAKAANDEQSMAEDFASDLDKELKASEKKSENTNENKSENKKPGNNNGNGYKRNYNQNRNGNNNHRQSGNRNGGNKNGNGNGNRRNNNQDNNQNGNRKNNNQDNKDKSFDIFEAKIVEDK